MNDSGANLDTRLRGPLTSVRAFTAVLTPAEEGGFVAFKRVGLFPEILYPFHPLFGKDCETFGSAGGEWDMVYVRLADRKAPRYGCLTGNREQGTPSCLAFAGWRVEKAIVEVVLEACQPLGVEASLQVLEKSHEEGDQKRKALELAWKRPNTRPAPRNHPHRAGRRLRADRRDRHQIP